MLCSGYIWQPDNGRYNVLDDSLRQSIVSGCIGGTLTTVAGKFSSAYYKDYYRNFISDLRLNGVNVIAYYAPRKNWHAKIAIRTNQDCPVAALVGSSNLTGPAYGIDRNSWNYEADVLIWSESGNQTSYFRNDDMDLPLGRLEAILDPKIIQASEEKQLKSIYEDVMKTELLHFE